MKADAEKKKEKTSTWTLLLIMPYLLSQIILWGYILICLLPERHLPFTELTSWKVDQYWRDGLDFKFWLAIA